MQVVDNQGRPGEGVGRFPHRHATHGSPNEKKLGKMSKIHLIGLSGGKDSTALLGWAIHESGYPRDSIQCTFCDTENEYEEVYQQIRDLDRYAQAHGCPPVRTLKSDRKYRTQFPGISLFLAMCLGHGRFPSAVVRFCTSELKMEPTEKFIKGLQADGHEVISHSGVRAAESFERSTMAEWATDHFGCPVYRPLLRKTLADIWAMHTRYGLPINPLYKAGWKRVGCRLCIMSNKADIRRTVVKRPWVIALYRKWEAITSAYRAGRLDQVGSYSSWFQRDKVPEHQRTLKIRTNSGESMMVCSIDDVARWSTTKYGGREQDTILDEERFDLDDAHAPCKSGYCE